ATGPWLIQLAHGRGSAHVTDEPYVARSRSRETTFQENLTDWEQVRHEVARLAETGARGGTADGRQVVRVVVKLRCAPFFTRTHGQRLPAPSTDPRPMVDAALAALDRFDERRPVRLVGVR